MLVGNGAEEALGVQAHARANRTQHLIISDIGRSAIPISLKNSSRVGHHQALLLRIKSATHRFYTVDRVTLGHLRAHTAEPRPVLHILYVVVEARTAATAEHRLARFVDLLIDGIKNAADQNRTPAYR